MPTGVHVLKPPKRKSAVFRLLDAMGSGRHVIAKCAGPRSILTEARVYAELLPRLAVRSLACYASQVDDEEGWLFLEDGGDVAWDPDDAGHMGLAAEWFATVHTSSAQLDSLAAWLPSRALAGYVGLMGSALDTLRRGVKNAALSPSEATLLVDAMRLVEWNEARWPTLSASSERLSDCLVIGSFGRKNARVRSRSGSSELIVFDLEGVGWGSPAADLALLDIDLYARRYVESYGDATRSQLLHAQALGKVLWAVAAIPGELPSLLCSWPHDAVKKVGYYREYLMASRAIL